MLLMIMNKTNKRILTNRIKINKIVRMNKEIQVKSKIKIILLINKDSKRMLNHKIKKWMKANHNKMVKMNNKETNMDKINFKIDITNSILITFQL